MTVALDRHGGCAPQSPLAAGIVLFTTQPQSIRVDSYLIYALPSREGFISIESLALLLYTICPRLQMLTPQQKYC